jgi:ATP synthase protein I
VSRRGGREELEPRDLGREDPRRERLEREVGEKAERTLRARAEGRRSVWFGLGMFGLVGWSVAIPTVAGAALGMWLDRLWPDRISWTLTLLLAGLALGCLNAWRWLERERRR